MALGAYFYFGDSFRFASRVLNEVIRLDVKFGKWFCCCMNAIPYSYSAGKGLEEYEAKDISELKKQARQLYVPNRSLFLNPPSSKDGYLDFHVLDDGSIEMEILDGLDDDFATVDIPISEQVIEIMWSDCRNLPLKQKLNDLPIKWIT
jgi:hypothetical protein